MLFIKKRTYNILINQWVYSGNPIKEEDFHNKVSFVYLITNLKNDKKYFGKKKLHFFKRKKVKNRKNKKIIRSDSDWRDYWGSSEELLNDVEVLGKENFKREILIFCDTLAQASYYEAKYQLEHDVLLHPDKFYNHWVSVRVRRNHLIKKCNNKEAGVLKMGTRGSDVE